MIWAVLIGFLEVSWTDILDIGLVAVLLYQLYRLMQGTLAIRIFIGVLVLYFVFLVVKTARLQLLSLILDQFTGVGVLAVIILFQPELRRFLILLGMTTALGRNKFLRNVIQFFSKNEVPALDIEEVTSSLMLMASAKTGALIVVSKDNPLDAFTALGDPLDALVSRRLLLSIFEKNGPMHDGAVIIHQNRIVAARCILPMSEKTSVSARFGTRHRAALGISEETNALVLVVSEETGTISLVQAGRIEGSLGEDDIRHQLITYLQGTA